MATVENLTLYASPGGTFYTYEASKENDGSLGRYIPYYSPTASSVSSSHKENVPVDESQNIQTPMVGRKKKKNEKDRLCHVLPRDLLLEAEEHFMRLLFDCPCIWNHTIDVKLRHPEAKVKKWLHIQEELIIYLQGLELNVDGSTIKVPLLKNTWDKIRKNYVRYKNDSFTSSGAATKDIDPPDHVDVMRVYDGMLAKRKQVSSLTDNNDCSYLNRKHKLVI